MIVELRQCRVCGFRVARIAAVCPVCKTASPGYSPRELAMRNWKFLVVLVAAIVIVAVLLRPFVA